MSSLYKCIFLKHSKRFLNFSFIVKKYFISLYYRIQNLLAFQKIKVLVLYISNDKTVFDQILQLLETLKHLKNVIAIMVTIMTDSFLEPHTGQNLHLNITMLIQIQNIMLLVTGTFRHLEALMVQKTYILIDLNLLVLSQRLLRLCDTWDSV